MKRPFSLLLAIPLLAAGPLAAATSRAPLAEGASVPGAEWVRQAVPPADAEADAVQIAGGRIPAILLEVTPGYTFESGKPLGLKVAMDPKGLSSAATLYLSRQDRVSGTRTWYNIPSGSFGTEQRDLFGTSTTPVPVNVPKLSDFALFGPGGALGPAITVSQPVGRYMFVLEVRDATGTKVISKGWALYSVVSGTEVLQGAITQSRTLTADKQWLLKGAVFVRQPATLTIERGTVVAGEFATKGTLIVDRGAKIVAQGSALQPIIFTTDQAVGTRGRGDWGGLIINGFAPVNIPGGIGQGEGNTGSYGGGTSPDPNDNSGVLSYVRVEFAGIEFSPDNELNGITFHGVGRGTTV
jgi:hypothetical protein